MPFPADGKKVKLGKGALFLAPLADDGSDRGYEDVGNVSALSLGSETTAPEIYSSRQAVSTLLDRTVTRIAYTLTATCNEFLINNLRKWLQGEVHTKAQALNASDSKTFENVVPGNYYDLGKRRVSDVVITADGSNLLVSGTDYSLNTEFGVFRLLPGGQAQDGDDVTVDFASPALTITQVRIAKIAAAQCRLLFLSDDSNTGGSAAHDRLECWRAAIAPDGELNLIGDEYGAFQLSISLLSDADHPDDPYGTLDRIGAA